MAAAFAQGGHRHQAAVSLTFDEWLDGVYSCCPVCLRKLITYTYQTCCLLLLRVGCWPRTCSTCCLLVNFYFLQNWGYRSLAHWGSVIWY